MLDWKCFNIPRIQGRKVNLIVSTIITSLDETIPSLDLEPCVCINTTGKVRIIPSEGKRMRDKKNERRLERPTEGLLPVLLFRACFSIQFVATNLTKILVINKLNELFLRQMGNVLLFCGDFCG